MINWKTSDRKRSWPNLRYYHGILLKGLWKTKKNLIQVNRSPSRDSKQEPFEYEAGVLTIRPRRSVDGSSAAVSQVRNYNPLNWA
jgi:hypothetical protein